MASLAGMRYVLVLKPAPPHAVAALAKIRLAATTAKPATVLKIVVSGAAWFLQHRWRRKSVYGQSGTKSIRQRHARKSLNSTVPIRTQAGAADQRTARQSRNVKASRWPLVSTKIPTYSGISGPLIFVETVADGLVLVLQCVNVKPDLGRILFVQQDSCITAGNLLHVVGSEPHPGEFLHAEP